MLNCPLMQKGFLKAAQVRSAPLHPKFITAYKYTALIPISSNSRFLSNIFRPQPSDYKLKFLKISCLRSVHDLRFQGSRQSGHAMSSVCECWSSRNTMDEFLKFLRTAKESLNNSTLYNKYNVIHLVVGNESCDLDSTISALSLAHLISHKATAGSGYLVIPVINVEAKHFHLRTEICYLLEKHGIDKNILIFRDQISYSDLLKTGKVKTSIVDHHVLSNHDKILEKTIVEIIDHRRINLREICHSDALSKIVIKTVGSCSTLVAQEIINLKSPILFEQLCHLLYATIIYDTIALNKEFGKTFDEDVVVAQYLENVLNILQNRKALFDTMWQIHTDTSGLSSLDLLYRDLKVVKNIPMPGLPMLVEDYLKREDAYDAIASFASEYNSANVILIGIDASKEVKRDIAIFSTDIRFRDKFIHILQNSKQIAGSDLLLSEISVENKNIVCFRQGNIKLTRKFILPLVNEAVLQYSITQ